MTITSLRVVHNDHVLAHLVVAGGGKAGAFRFSQRIAAMSPKALLSRLPVDPYIVAIVGTVCLASVLPAYGSGAIIARYATYAAIALLFFLHGARLSPQAALAGASHWRLHIVVLASTFLLFPALGLGAKALFPGLLTPPLWTGVILLLGARRRRYRPPASAALRC